MKALIAFTTLALVAIPAARAESRCGVEAKAAVEAQVRKDFPNQSLTVIVPDYNDMGDQREVVYDVGAYQTDDLSKLVAHYSVMVNETCQVMSGPTREP